MDNLIYCTTTEEGWSKAKQIGVFVHESLNDEGFIHCSYEHQLLKVIKKHFFDTENILILTIDIDKLDAFVKVENGFPHIYGTINLPAVVDVKTR